MTLAVVALTDETVIDPTRYINQDRQDVAGLNDGGWIVTYKEEGKIVQQRYDVNGVKLGAPVKVSTLDGTYKDYTTVGALTDGGWVVAWSEDKQDGTSTNIYAQRFDASGAKVGSEFQVNATAANHQIEPFITSLVGGGYVVAWKTAIGSSYTVYCQVYGANGVAVGPETQLTTQDSRNPNVAALEDGGFIMVWDNVSQVGMERFDASGNKIGTEVSLNLGATGYGTYASVTGLNGGGWVLTWSVDDNGNVANNVFIYQQVYDANGNTVGQKTKVSTTGGNYTSTSSVATMADGRWVVMWTRLAGSGATTMYAQVFNVDGTKLGGEITINQNTAGTRNYPSVTALADSRIVFTWSGNYDPAYPDTGGNIYQRVYAVIDNQPPVLTGTQTTLALGFEDSPFVVTKAQLLTGYTDVNPETPISMANLVANNGTVVDNLNGTFTITPTANFNGEMTLSYTVTDGLESVAATLKYGVVPTADFAGGATTQVNTTTAGQQIDPLILPLAGGGWRVKWHTGATRYYQDYDANGGAIGTETIDTGGDPRKTAFLSDGTSVTIWKDTDNSLSAQRHDASGNAIGSAITINGITSGSVSEIEIKSFDDGKWMVLWEGGTTNDTQGFWALYNADGSLSATHTLPTYGTGYYENAVVTQLKDGGFVIAYTFDSTAGIEAGIYGPELYLARYNADGSLNSTRRITDTNDGALYFPAVAGTPSGGWIVAYADTVRDGIFYQIFNPDGTAQAEQLVSVYNFDDIYQYSQLIDIIVKDNGDFVVTWLSYGDDGDQLGVFQKMFESDAIIGTDAADLLLGTAGNDVLIGLGGNDTINGGGGNDAMYGGAGNDTYSVDNIYDYVLEGLGQGDSDRVNSTITYVLTDNVEQLVLSGAANIDGTGNALNNTIFGSSGNNRIDGGIGADTLRGNAGNDTYVVDNVLDVVVEGTGAGTDIIESSVTYTLSTNVEDLTLTGSAAINGTGNSLANVLRGNSGNNLLSGGTGADTFFGGAGDDRYYVDNAGDIVREDTVSGVDDGGLDIVISTISYSLGAFVEQLSLGYGDIDATGNSLDNGIWGNLGNNRIDGGAGNDTMAGLTGNDTYVVDNVLDVVVEITGTGTDIIESSVTYTLSTNVEELSLTGTAAINGTGNSLANVLRGNSGNNLLNGGTGVDTFFGGAGDDTYVVDSFYEVVREDTVGGIDDGGNDKVTSYVTYTLGNFIERLTLAGASDINGTGNALNNVIFGNAGANFINGGLGSDTLRGLGGDDTYVVDNLLDVVTEDLGAGTDRVNSSVSYVLGNNLENLSLTGSANIDATGNTLNNLILGNSGNNRISGGAGNDNLQGGDGNDTYVFGLGFGVDTIRETSGIDTIEFGLGITSGDIITEVVGADLYYAIAQAGRTASQCANRLRIMGGASTPIENVIFTSTPVGAPVASSAALAQSITAFAAPVAQTDDLIDTAKAVVASGTLLSSNLGKKALN